MKISSTKVQEMANHFIKVKSLINSPSRYISNLNILSFNLNAWSLLVSQSVRVCVNFERGRREFCQIQKGYSHQYCLPLVHPCFSSCFCANVKPCEDLHEVSLLNDTIINQLQYYRPTCAYEGIQRDVQRILA